MSRVPDSSVHVPVMLAEVLTMLRASEGGCYLDCTLGGGGHSRAILESNTGNTVVAIDRDPMAIQRARKLEENFPGRFQASLGCFSDIPAVTSGRQFYGVLADLGMSTDQLKGERGFSFADESSLDMRMNPEEGESAYEFLNSASEREIFLALAKGGVGGTAKPLARLLVNSREIRSASQLAEIVRGARLGKRADSKSHPATVVFQAIRMHINRELEQINELLSAVPGVVAPGGRVAIITFHSLEDRHVTKCLRDWDAGDTRPASWPGVRDQKTIGSMVTRKPVVPSDAEVDSNPASRSARLRVFEFSKQSEKVKESKGSRAG